MPRDASEVEAILRLLIPGFVALKVFYAFGAQLRRSDFEWTVWSIVVAVAINAVLDRLLAPSDPVFRLILAAVLGGLGAFVAARFWLFLARTWPKLRALASRRAWDLAFSPFASTPYVVVRTVSGTSVYGWPEAVTASVDSDQVDLFVRQPEWVDDDGDRTPMAGVHGVYIPESSIEFVQVYELEEPLDE